MAAAAARLSLELIQVPKNVRLSVFTVSFARSAIEHATGDIVDTDEANSLIDWLFKRGCGDLELPDAGVYLETHTLTYDETLGCYVLRSHGYWRFYIYPETAIVEARYFGALSTVAPKTKFGTEGTKKRRRDEGCVVFVAPFAACNVWL
jgi:hypothetical protein